MASKLRDAAAAFVQAGRTLGHADADRGMAEELRRRAAECQDPERAILNALADERAAVADQLAGLAALARDQATALMTELEHPGSTLARRLLAVARSARAAWRGSR